MFPSLSSLIPIQVALARFFSVHGIGSIKLNYPYWYLGTTPFKYLTGPVVPFLSNVIKKLWPVLSWFEAWQGLMVFSFLLGVLGVILLVKELKDLKHGLVSGFLYGFGALVPGLMFVSDGLKLISFSFLPFVWLVYVRWLKKNSLERMLGVGLGVGLALLIDARVVIQMVLGMILLAVVSLGWERMDKIFKKTILMLLFGFLLASNWYSVKYWFLLLVSPSLAGKTMVKVIAQAGKLLPMMLALVLSMGFSKKVRKLQNRALEFSYYWLVIFVFLSLIRFISDPDFWMDWTQYSHEIQLGVGIMLASYVLRQQKALGGFFRGVLLVTWLVLFGVVVKYQVVDRMQMDVSRSAEYQVGKFLSDKVKPEEKVFLSGSSAFWLNAWFDVSQVRGGNDQASIDPDWRAMAWEIREGTDGEKAVDWLRRKQVNWLVVHTRESREYYHDFKHEDKFQEVEGLEKVYDIKGDRVYKLTK